jgi:integrase
MFAFIRVPALDRPRPSQFLFAGRGEPSRGLTTRQYARLVGEWIASIGLDPLKFNTHSLRRTKATLIYRRTGNLRAFCWTHQDRERRAFTLASDLDDAIEIAEKIDV